MSFNVYLKDEHLEIDNSQLQNTLDEIKRAVRGVTFSIGGYEDVEKAKTLEEAMFILGYELETIDEEYNIVLFSILKINSGYLEDDKFIKALLQNARPGSYLMFEDEDGESWKIKKQEDGSVEEVYMKLAEEMSDYAFDNMLEAYKSAIKTRDTEEINKIEEILRTRLTR